MHVVTCARVRNRCVTRNQLARHSMCACVAGGGLALRVCVCVRARTHNYSSNAGNLFVGKLVCTVVRARVIRFRLDAHERGGKHQSIGIGESAMGGGDIGRNSGGNEC